jgi:hypothetical protein
VFGLLFDSTADAQLALNFLPGFTLGTEDPSTPKRGMYRLAYGRKDGEPFDARTEVDDVRELLEKFRVFPKGAHDGAIDGTPFSIDYGPLFFLDFGPALARMSVEARQLPLF